jgi:hypothetical protein
MKFQTELRRAPSTDVLGIELPHSGPLPYAFLYDKVDYRLDWGPECVEVRTMYERSKAEPLYASRREAYTSGVYPLMMAVHELVKHIRACRPTPTLPTMSAPKEDGGPVPMKRQLTPAIRLHAASGRAELFERASYAYMHGGRLFFWDEICPLEETEFPHSPNWVEQALVRSAAPLSQMLVGELRTMRAD